MRLIDADALKEKLINLEPRCANKFVQQGLDDGLHYYMPKIIDEQPTIDAVEVVRCKDCLHYQQRHLDRESYMVCHAMGYCIRHQPTFYCWHGKRRDSDG